MTDLAHFGDVSSPVLAAQGLFAKCSRGDDTHGSVEGGTRCSRLSALMLAESYPSFSRRIGVTVKANGPFVRWPSSKKNAIQNLI